jgi:16S rRNA (adenine1518-N6/adenine1519-N6)-dimethyltransferase
LKVPRDITPKQSLGQNFLIDPNVARNIVAAMQLTKEDSVLEIGPGLGVLTVLVQPLAGKFVAVEIDKKLAAMLKANFLQCPNFELIEGDFLQLDFDQWEAESNWRIIGNIPYHITSPILFKVLDARERVQDITLLIQKEVAQRMVAAPSTKEYGILAIISQTFADVKTLLQVQRTVFKPQPKVDSSLVRWSFTDKRSKLIEDNNLFRKAVRQAFGQRRKMLRHSLRRAFSLDGLSAQELTSRPEQLSIAEWIDLSNRLRLLPNE